MLQSQVEDLPVAQETVKAFVDEWQKLDVRGTSYISVRDLPKLITRLANSKKGQKMLVFPNLIRQGDKHDIDNYIRLLEIPTFRQLKRVMFHDVMQQLCLIVIKVQRNKDKLNEKLKLIDTHGSGLFHTPHRTFSAVSQLAMDVTFHNVKRSKFDFDVMIRNLGMLNHRIELVSEMFELSFKLNAKYRPLVDTVENLDKKSCSEGSACRQKVKHMDES